MDVRNSPRDPIQDRCRRLGRGGGFDRRKEGQRTHWTVYAGEHGQCHCDELALPAEEICWCRLKAGQTLILGRDNIKRWHNPRRRQ